MNPVDVAIDFISKGFPVFPCRSSDEADSQTGEIYCAKSPLTPNGLNGATVNERLCRELFKRNPNALVGIPTGRLIGAFVVDIDVKSFADGTSVNGYESLEALEAVHGKLPDTARAKTPSGGMHYYFKHVDGLRNTTGKIGHGIDTRSDGGFVIAPGSTMQDGKRYEWIEPRGEIADAPKWLLDLVLPAKHAPTHYTGGTVSNDNYVNAAIDMELRDLANWPQGGRNNRLNDAAFALGQFVAAGAITRHAAEGELYAIAGQWENFAKSKGTIKSGLDGGEKFPRQIPEPAYKQDNTPLVDISGLLKKKPAEPEAPIVEVATPIPTAFHATPFLWKDPRDLPRREFLYGTHLIRKYVSATVSPGGIGKTALGITEAMAMVTAKPLLGIKPACPLRVWLFNAEDPRDEMDRRVMAAAMNFNIKPKELEERLFLDVGREQALVIAVDNKKGVVIQRPIVDAVIEQIRKYEIDVMTIDPFVSTHEVSENDNMAIDKVVKTWAYIADVTNIAIDLVHHVKKVEGREITVDDSRGASALLGAARSVRVLNRMTQEQAAKAGVVENINSHFSVTRGKANMSPNVGDSEWRKLEGVGLGNGRGIMAPQDHVGVVTEWKWPGAEEIMEALPDDTLSNVRNVLDAGAFRENVQAGDWAGYAICRVMGLDVDDPAAKARAKQLLKIWKDEGELVRLDLPDAKGVTRPYLKSALWVARQK